MGLYGPRCQSIEGRTGHIVVSNGSAMSMALGRWTWSKMRKRLTLFGPRCDWVLVTVLSCLGALFPFCFPRMLAILLSAPWHCSKVAYEKLPSILSHRGNAMEAIMPPHIPCPTYLKGYAADTYDAGNYKHWQVSGEMGTSPIAGRNV